MSIGFCSIFGRLAGAVTPIIMIALFMVYPGLPFVFLGIVCMFTYYLTRDLPDQPYDDLVENN